MGQKPSKYLSAEERAQAEKKVDDILKRGFTREFIYAGSKKVKGPTMPSTKPEEPKIDVDKYLAVLNAEMRKLSPPVPPDPDLSGSRKLKKERRELARNPPI